MPTCPICRGNFQTTKAGVLRSHGPRSGPCKGSGTNPIEASPPPTTIQSLQQTESAIQSCTWIKYIYLIRHVKYYVRNTNYFFRESSTVLNRICSSARRMGKSFLVSRRKPVPPNSLNYNLVIREFKKTSPYFTILNVCVAALCT